MNSLETIHLGIALRELADDQALWSQRTFGPDSVRGPIGPLRHLVKEATEAELAWIMHGDQVGGDRGIIATEIADCLLLVLDANRRAGFTVRELVDAAAAKMVVNKSKERKWPPFDPKQVENPVEHVREPEQSDLNRTDATR